MESSTVSPSSCRCPTPVVRVSMQCPPETSRAVWGKGTSRSARKTLARCPSRWFTLTTGSPQPRASALAVEMPTRSAPTRPGSRRHRDGAELGPGTPASASAWSTMEVISSTWARLASSGTTPPNAAWRSIWLATTDERTSRCRRRRPLRSRRTTSRWPAGSAAHGSSARPPPSSAIGARGSAPLPVRPPVAARRTLTSVDGTASACPPSMTRPTWEPSASATSRGRGRGGRAVAVGAGHQQDAGRSHQREEEAWSGMRTATSSRPSSQSRASGRGEKPKTMVNGPGHQRSARARRGRRERRRRAGGPARAMAARTGRCSPSGRSLAR